MNCVKCNKPVEHIDDDWGPLQICDDCQAKFEANYQRALRQRRDEETKER